MKKAILAATFTIAVIAAPLGALAQTTGPAGQQDTNKVGTQNPGSGNTTGERATTSTGMTKDGMTKDTTDSGGMMKQGGESKDGMGSNKGGMSK